LDGLAERSLCHTAQIRPCPVHPGRSGALPFAEPQAGAIKKVRLT
jgi:hypothetical protein